MSPSTPISRRSRSWHVFQALLALACALGAACWAASCSTKRESVAQGAAGEYFIGVSPFIPKAKIPAVRSALFRTILEKVPSGGHVTVFDAYRLSRITDFGIPPGEAFNRLKIRTKHLGRNLGEIQKFLDASATGGGEADGRIRAPQLLDLIAGSRRDKLTQATVLLLGGALYLDPRDVRFSMDAGRYPADDHLCVARKDSVFGVADRRVQLTGARIHYAYLVDPWINDLHEEPVRRFWSLFIAGQGGELIAFAGDLPTVVDSIGEPASRSPWSYELHCPEYPKLELIAVRRELGSDPPIRSASQPRISSLKIGIRWSCADCDLDLYSRPAAGAAELFYRNPTTAEGAYFKDYLTSPTPAKAFEWIEYPHPVDLTGVEAAVNFYGGHSAGGVSGEVMVQTGEGTYKGEFRIKSPEGNRGGESDRRRGSRYWTLLDIGALAGLGKDGRPALPVVVKSEPQQAPEGVVESPREPPAFDQGAGQQDSRRIGAARGVRILSPQDGSRIRGGETPGPVPHPVDGDIYGFSQAEIQKFGLTVEVTVVTTGEFPQGIAEVHDNGTWRLPTAWFGGSRHTIRAVLKDSNDNEISSHEVSVTVIH